MRCPPDGLPPPQTNPASQTPAITIVELCSKEDTGVGAIIAFSSYPKNGNIADFVMTATSSKQPIINPTPEWTPDAAQMDRLTGSVTDPANPTRTAMDTKIATSPTLLYMTALLADFSLFDQKLISK